MATDFLRMVQGVQKRDVILEAEVRYVDKMRQEAQVRVVSPPSRTYTLQCDEGQQPHPPQHPGVVAKIYCR